MEIVIGLTAVLLLVPLVAYLGRAAAGGSRPGGLSLGLWMVFASAFDPPAKAAVEQIQQRQETGEPDAAKDEPLQRADDGREQPS